jgi:hypothetical protein
VGTLPTIVFLVVLKQTFHSSAPDTNSNTGHEYFEENRGKWDSGNTPLGNPNGMPHAHHQLWGQ